MGFDLSGENPIVNGTAPKEPNWETATKEEKDLYFKKSREFQEQNPGIYFRNNVWWWRPLWGYICDTCGDVLTEEDQAAGCFNDWHLIEEDKAIKIAERLQAMVNMGHTFEFMKTYMKDLEDKPDEKCEFCNGTGIRVWSEKDIEIHARTVDAISDLLNTDLPVITKEKTTKCNACGGKGKRRPFETNYPFNVQNVEDFIKFSSQSGGFRIG